MISKRDLFKLAALVLVIRPIKAFLATQRLKAAAFLKAHMAKIAAIFILGAIGAGVYGAARLDWVFIRNIGRDAAIAYLADRRAGGAIPFEPDYSGSESLPEDTTFMMVSNSNWLVVNTRMIAPFFSYEGLVEVAHYPRAVVFLPFVDDSSFHIAGRYLPPNLMGADIVILNERMFLRETSDEREVLATLVHELIHSQGGVFLTWPSERLESATVAGTIEVLAAMCNYENDLACAAFWNEINWLAMVSLRVNLNERNLGFVYDIYARLFRSESQQRRYEKAMRFWADDMETLAGIYSKYGRGPWVDHVMPGVCGQPLNTLNKVSGGHGTRFVLGMKFDDTRALLGNIARLITCG